MRGSLFGGAALLLLSIPSLAMACNYRQLEEDIRWCLMDPGADQNARAEIVAGAYNRDAARLDAGFDGCQAHSDAARENYRSCSPGARIDTARALLGWALLMTPELQPLTDQFNTDYRTEHSVP